MPAGNVMMCLCTVFYCSLFYSHEIRKYSLHVCVVLFGKYNNTKMALSQTTEQKLIMRILKIQVLLLANINLIPYKGGEFLKILGNNN